MSVSMSEMFEWYDTGNHEQLFAELRRDCSRLFLNRDGNEFDWLHTNFDTEHGHGHGPTISLNRRGETLLFYIALHPQIDFLEKLWTLTGKPFSMRWLREIFYSGTLTGCCSLLTHLIFSSKPEVMQFAARKLSTLDLTKQHLSGMSLFEELLKHKRHYAITSIPKIDASTIRNLYFTFPPKGVATVSPYKSKPNNTIEEWNDFLVAYPHLDPGIPELYAAIDHYILTVLEENSTGLLNVVVRILNRE